MSRRISSRTCSRRTSESTAACSSTSSATAASSSSPLGRPAAASARRRSSRRRRRSAASASAWRSATPTTGSTPATGDAPRGVRYARADRATLPAMAEIEVRQADITKLEVDAIANAANTELRHGGGVAGAIVRAGGRSIQDESDRVAPIELGEAVATGAGELPARWVIHAATMGLGGPTSAEAIRAATASTLRRRRRARRRSLALVAFGTGVGGFPIDERPLTSRSRRSAGHLEGDSGLERIVFCVFGERRPAGVRPGALWLTRSSPSAVSSRSAARRARSSPPG